MNMLRNRLLTAFPEAHFTYGYITTVQRKKLGLAKAHYRDAVAISGIQQIIEEPNSVVMFDQFRTKNDHCMKQRHAGGESKRTLLKNE